MEESQTVMRLDSFKADRFLEDGKHHISVGDLDLAIESLHKSIEIIPSPEAYTYLAWVLSLKEEFDVAIELCEKAIALDPDFGNPYNDIGSYLIQKGNLEEALPWLEKAKSAARYDTRHFPHMNLGRVYSALGLFSEAIYEFKKALEISPDHKEIQKVLKELEEIQNNA